MYNITEKIFEKAKSKKKGLLITAIIIAVLMLLYTLALPPLININQYKAKILELSEADKRFKGNLYVGKLGLELPLTGGIVFKISHIKLTHKNGDPLFSANNLKAKVAILPLLFKEIVIKNVEAQDLELHAIRKGQSNIDLEEIVLPPLPHDIYFIKFRGTRGHIKNYDIEITDKTLSPEKKILLTGKKIKLLKLTEDKNLKFLIEGQIDKLTPFKLRGYLKLPFQKQLAKNIFNIKGYIRNLNLQNFKPYLEYNDIKGTLSTRFKLKATEDELNISNRLDIINSVFIPDIDLNLLSGYINLKISIKEKALGIHNLESTLNDVNLKLKGNIYHWESKDPKFDLKLETDEFNILLARSLIPLIPETKDFLNQLKPFLLKGITKINTKIKGSASTPKLYGNLKIKDYTVRLPENIIINDIKGVFKLDGDKIKAKNWIIPLNSTELLQINGNFNFNKNHFENLQLSTTDLEINTLKKILLSIANTTNYRILLLDKLTSKGTLRLNIILDGLIDKPFLSGELFINVKNIFLQGYNSSINAIKGVLIFDKSSVASKELNIALTENDNILVRGKYNFHDEIFDGLKVFSDRIDLNRLQNILLATSKDLNIPVSELKRFDITGNTSVDINLKGNLNNIKPYGQAVLSNVSIVDKETKIPINKLTGQITFNDNINLNNLAAIIENNPIKINGTASISGPAKIVVSILEFKLSDIRALALKIGLFKSSEAELIKEASFEGSVSGEITLNKNKDTITPEAIFNINKSHISHPMLPDRIYLDRGKIVFKNTKVNINELTMTTSGSTFTISGNLDNLENLVPDYMIHATSKNVTYEFLKKLSAHSSAPKGFKELISSIKSITGNAAININARNKQFEMDINLNNLAIHMAELEKPIDNISGKIKLNNNQLVLSNVSAGYNESILQIAGDINSLNTTPIININIDGKLSPLSFKEFYRKDIQENLVFSEPINFEGGAKGNIKSWDIRFVSEIPQSAIVELKGVFNKPENAPLKFVIDGRGTKEFIDINNISLQVGQSQFNADGYLEYSDEDLIKIDNLNIKIPDINLDELNKFLAKGLLTDDLTGAIKSNLKISGTAFDPNIYGFINFDKVSLPIIKSKDISFNIDLSGSEADIENAYMNINGIIFEITTHINNFKKFPIELTNLNIHSPSLRLTDLLSSISSKAEAIKIDSLPITIKNGVLIIDDAIIDKLITSNLRGNITLCPDGTFQINNMGLNTAGGTATGNIYVNIIENTLGAQLQIVGVKANAAATILLDLPNEIFGDLNSTIVFNSKGNDYDQIIENAEGQASLIIDDGRFSRLGTLEHLLRASNIIGGGVSGLNINNILASVIPMHTGKFDQLTGDFSVKKGTLHTSNLITRGKNLSLEIAGEFNLYTEDADLTIQGNLSRNVSGLLGPLGNLNIDTLTDFIPGLGFIPGLSTKKKRIGLLDFIPGLGFIPGFGGPKEDDIVRKFAVEIKGKLYTMTSVKNFRWVK